MKDIQKRAEDKYAAKVRLNGHSVGRTFPTLKQAREWASRVEIAIHDEIANPNLVFNKYDWKPKRPEKPKSKKQLEAEALLEAQTPSINWSLSQAIKKYMCEDLEDLKGYKQALLRLKMWMRSEFADIPLKDISAEMVHQWKIKRRTNKGKIPSPSTIRNDLYRLSVIFETARKPVTKNGWGLTELHNPVQEILLPSPSAGRDRRLHGDEERRLRKALAFGCHAFEMSCFFEIALATGMRKSEILNATVIPFLVGH